MSVGAESTVSQREFDQFRETVKRDREVGDRERAQLRADLAQEVQRRERDVERLPSQLDEDIQQAVALAVAAAFKARGEERSTSLGRRIAAVAAGSGVVAAWVALAGLLLDLRGK